MRGGGAPSLHRAHADPRSTARPCSTHMLPPPALTTRCWGMKVVPMATSSPCRVDTVVGVDRSRTFSLSNVILCAGGWVGRWVGGRAGERGVLRACAGKLAAPLPMWDPSHTPLPHTRPPYTHALMCAPELVHLLPLVRHLPGGQVEVHRHKPVLQAVRHAAPRGRRGGGEGRGERRGVARRCQRALVPPPSTPDALAPHPPSPHARSPKPPVAEHVY